MRLDKGLYGLKQAGRGWNRKFLKDLKAWGFVASQADPCLFIKSKGESQLRVLLFVDDMALMNDRDANGRALRDKLMANIKAKYEFSCSDDEDTYLGMRIVRIDKTTLHLSQERKATDIMLRYRDAFGVLFDKCVPTHTVSPGGRISVVDCPDCKPKDNPDGEQYRSMVGALRWLEQGTRPDISATLSELSKVQNNPGPVHVARLHHLMRYVNTTKNRGLTYGGAAKDIASAPIVGYVDSDWAGDPDTLYSRGGHLFTAWGTPVSWCSRKMKAVAASSTESEYMAMSLAVRESIWLRYLFSDLGYGDLTTKEYGKFCDQDFAKARLSDIVDPSEKPMTCFGDNMGANAMSRNDVLHKRSKHIRIGFHITRRQVAGGHVILHYIPSAENIADLLTKSLTRVPHLHLCDKIMHDLVDGKLFLPSGAPVEYTMRKPVRDALYDTVPAGLDPTRGDDDITPRGSHYEEAFAIDTVKALVGALFDDMSMVILDHALVTLCARPIFSAVVNAKMIIPTELLELIASQAIASHVRRHYTILDSGASHSYGDRHAKLTNTRPGTGGVLVANGVREMVTEVGSLGAVPEVQRVLSFSRSLISVSDITDLYGSVIFNSSGASIISNAIDSTTGLPFSTQIATRTPERLYEFDGAALSRHISAVAVAAQHLQAGLAAGLDAVDAITGLPDHHGLAAGLDAVHTLALLGSQSS